MVQRLTIAAGSVHVWQADLEQIPERLTALLGDEERARAASILPPSARRLWPRSRALLRLLLARYSGQPADSLELQPGTFGKPRLARDAQLHFNLSHSGPLALYALSREGPVGVDVERAGRRPAAFLRDWTRREAAVKCLGTGLGGALAAGDAGEAVWVGELDLGSHALGALACSRVPPAIERFGWEPGA